ncbi:MAG: hypothetical protein JWQ43_572 [Glaciihabitans sp.]|nr:hypothetical protein [Glaciihabitans sp.]
MEGGDRGCRDGVQINEMAQQLPYGRRCGRLVTTRDQTVAKRFRMFHVKHRGARAGWTRTVCRLQCQTAAPRDRWVGCSLRPRFLVNRVLSRPHHRWCYPHVLITRRNDGGEGVGPTVRHVNRLHGPIESDSGNDAQRQSSKSNSMFHVKHVL